MRASLPRVLLHLEGATLFVAAVWAYSVVGPGWGWFALLFLAPDLSMLGYLGGMRMGAACYNAAHTYVAPAALILLGAAAGFAPAAWLAAIWVAHIGIDRLVGYGLKYPSGFKDTHLART